MKPFISSMTHVPNLSVYSFICWPSRVLLPEASNNCNDFQPRPITWASVFITHSPEYRKNNDKTAFEGKGTAVGEVGQREILRAYYISPMNIIWVRFPDSASSEVGWVCWLCYHKLLRLPSCRNSPALVSECPYVFWCTAAWMALHRCCPCPTFFHLGYLLAPRIKCLIELFSLVALYKRVVVSGTKRCEGLSGRKDEYRIRDHSPRVWDHKSWDQISKF